MLSVDVGNLRYDALAEFIQHLSKKLIEDSNEDLKNNRCQLATQLQLASRELSNVKKHIERAWKISKPFMIKEISVDDFISKYSNKIFKPEKWTKLIGVKILDPDGWDRTNFRIDIEKKLSLLEFLQKAAMSTTNFPKLYRELCDKML
jgi:hypothetical protein